MESRAEYLRARNERVLAIARHAWPWWAAVVSLLLSVAIAASACVSVTAEFLLVAVLFVFAVIRSRTQSRDRSALAAIFAEKQNLSSDKNGVADLPIYMLDPGDTTSARDLDRLVAPRGVEPGPLTGNSTRSVLSVVPVGVVGIAVSVLAIITQLNGEYSLPRTASVMALMGWMFVGLADSAALTYLDLRRRRLLAKTELERLWAVDPHFDGRVVKAGDGQYRLAGGDLIGRLETMRPQRILGFIILGFALLQLLFAASIKLGFVTPVP